MQFIRKFIGPLVLCLQTRGRLFGTCVIGYLCSSPVWAFTLTPLDGFDFGKLAIPSNSLVHSVIMSRNGGYTTPGQFILIEPGNAGRYRLSGYPPSTPVTFSIPASPLLIDSGPASPELTVSAVTQQTPISTDVNGELVFSLGATLSSNGSGVAYGDGTYSGTVPLTVTYPTAGGSEFREHDIQFTAQLQTTLVLTELTGLSFGPIGAWPSPADSASLTIGPQGSALVSSPGAARIILLGGVSPGVFQVISGAPGAPVQITLPGEISMSLVGGALDTPRFRVTDFTTSPASNALRFNSQGVLDIKLGATIRTELTAGTYPDGEYSGTYTLTVNY